SSARPRRSRSRIRSPARSWRKRYPISPTVSRFCAARSGCCGQDAPDCEKQASPPKTSTSSSRGGDPMTDHHPAASLGKRLLPAIALTASAAGLVVVLDRPPNGSAVDGRGDSAASPDAAPDTAHAVTPIPPPTTPPAPTVAPAIPVPSPSPSIVPPAVSSTTLPAAKQPAAATTCERKTIDGPTENTRWGPVQVEAVVSSSGQICDVDAIQSPNSHRRSVAINN